MTVLRGAVIGCGMIAEHHLKAWRALPEVTIAALCDRDPAAAARRRDELAPDARVYTDLQALLRAERPDFVDILTPPDAHVEHCLLAAEAGAHVICQKPIAPSLDAAAAVVRALSGRDRLFVVHENHRHRPWFEDILRRHAAGAFGRVRLVHLEQLDAAAPIEAYKRAAPRGVLLEYGTHLVDMVRALLGDPAGVLASTARVNPQVAGESVAHVTFTFPDATAIVHVGWKAGGPATGRALVLGDRGEAIYDGTMTRGESARFRLVAEGVTVLDEPRRPMDDYAASFLGLQRAFVGAVLRGAPIPQPARDNLATLRATFAAYASAEQGRFVALEEIRP